MRHRLKIRGGPAAQSFMLELDDRPLYGVVAFDVKAEMGERCTATITLHAQLDLDGELETLVVQAPITWRDRLARALQWMRGLVLEEVPCR